MGRTALNTKCYDMFVDQHLYCARRRYHLTATQQQNFEEL